MIHMVGVEVSTTEMGVGVGLVEVVGELEEGVEAGGGGLLDAANDGGEVCTVSSGGSR